MNNDNLYSIINRVIKDKVFQYEGPFISGVPDFNVKCSFKLELIDDVKLIHMGNPRNHVGVKVIITDFHPIQFIDLINSCTDRSKCWDNLYYFTRQLTEYIWRVLQHFSINDDPSIESIEYVGEPETKVSNINLKESIKRILRENDYSPAGKEVIPNKIIVHKSNPIFRDKILTEGLRVKAGECYKIYVGYGVKCRPAIFATNSTNKRAWFDSTYDDDIWEINTEMIPDVKWFKDRHFESRSKHIVTFQNIPVDALKLIYKGNENNGDMIKESRGEKRNVVRQIVRDIIQVFKNEGEGDYLLPEDINDEMTYTFHNLKTDFTVELSIVESEDVNGFDLDGGYYDDEDTLEISITYNPNDFPKSSYDLVGELNEVVRHELEHLLQAERGDVNPTGETDSEKYYTQPHELGAEVAGFKRSSKLKKQPFEKSVRDWFNRNKHIHGMDDDATERVIQRVLNHYRNGK